MSASPETVFGAGPGPARQSTTMQHDTTRHETAKHKMTQKPSTVSGVTR